MNYRYWDLIPPFKLPNLIWGGDNVYHRNCKRIEIQLCKHNIEAKVHRHRLFDKDFFIVNVSDNDNFLNKKDIADALDIPVDWVDLYKYTDDLEEYCILEDKIIDMYGDCHKELHFKEPFDFLDAVHNVCSPHSIVKQLNEKQSRKTAKVLFDNDGAIVLLKDVHMADFLVAEALDIPKDAVIDISCESEEFSHIILIDRCKE